MHEMSMAENILEIIGHYVPEHQQPHVRVVKMRVGELSNIVPESLEFCFGAITLGGPLEQAVIPCGPAEAGRGVSRSGTQTAPRPR